jgi:hypothetical protein
VRDQAELVGIINRPQGWGIELRGVRQLAPGDATISATPTTARSSTEE